MDMPGWFRRAEGAVVAIAAVIVAVNSFDWWWLLVLFLAFDLSMLGYLFGPRVGAVTYNLVHNYAGAVVLLLLWAGFGMPWFGIIGIAWAFHVGVDHVLGYGLKHPDAFQHTDLGWIGKARRAPAA